MAFVLTADLSDAAEDGLWSGAWSGSGQIVVGSCDETVRTFTLAEDQSALLRQHELRGHDLGVTSVTVSTEANLAASSSLDSHIRVWDLERGSERLSIDAGPIEAWTVALSPDGKLIASGSDSGCVNVWSVATGERVESISSGADKFVMSVAYSPDARHMACGAADGGVYLIDVETSAVVRQFDGHSATVRALAFSPDGARLITGSDDAHVNQYEVSSGIQVRQRHRQATRPCPA
jgi:WD repeat-containing protein 61